MDERRSATRNEFQKLLKKAGLGMEDVMAEALSSKIDTFERFDRMLASAEARRNNALREIDRHRSALGAAVRQVIDDVEDAEFRDVETGEVGGGPPP
jgi:predicted outer membrane protein